MNSSNILRSILALLSAAILLLREEMGGEPLNKPARIFDRMYTLPLKIELEGVSSVKRGTANSYEPSVGCGIQRKIMAMLPAPNHYAKTRYA
jgi:hypothetical protein